MALEATWLAKETPGDTADRCSNKKAFKLEFMRISYIPLIIEEW